MLLEGFCPADLSPGRAGAMLGTRFATPSTAAPAMALVARAGSVVDQGEFINPVFYSHTYSRLQNVLRYRPRSIRMLREWSDLYRNLEPMLYKWL